MYTFTKEYLIGLADNLAETVTHPKFLERIEDIQNAENSSEQYALADKIEVEGLKKDGVKIPEGLRVTPRTFEDPEYARKNGVQPAGVEPGTKEGEANFESFDYSSWPKKPLEGQPDEMPEPKVIVQHLRNGLYEIAEYVSGEPFRALLGELAACPAEDRAKFVLDVILHAEERKARGVEVPEHMMIQRSTFHDGRPTLFCVSALTPLGYPWRKVTFTFDNEILDGAGS